MIGPSDNTATNAWIERLSVYGINARCGPLGFEHISSSHDPEAPPRDGAPALEGLRLARSRRTSRG